MIGLLLLAAALGSADVDMLAHFKAGESLCSNPDDVTKTCSAITRLSIQPDGTMRETGEILLTPGQPITLEVTSIVFFDETAMCGVMDLADIRRGIVRSAGSPLAADRNAAVLDRLQPMFAPLAGQRVCEALQVKDGKLLKVGQADRVDVPLPGKPVRWITAADEFRVAPRLSAAQP